MGETDECRLEDHVTGSIGLVGMSVCSMDRETHIGRS